MLNCIDTPPLDDINASFPSYGEPLCSVDLDSATDSNNDTALTLACAGGHEDLVKLLLARGANIEHRDKKGFTPLILAATAGHAGVVEVLLTHGADLEAQSERTKDTPLSLACSGGRYEVVEMLLQRGANKEHRNVSDYTPLSLAASGGYVNIIKLLLDHGAEINSRTGSKLGISPLMLAAMNGHTAAVKLLLDCGSDINAQIETNRNTALTLACFQGRHEVVSLLVDRRANIEHRAKTGLTPLMEAASGGYVEVGRVLLDKGGDVNAPPVPSSRDTALTIAADKGHQKFVELLLQRGAQVDAKNKKGNSPLWLAANGGHLDVVQLLHTSNADIDSQDNRKVSCLMSAFRKGHIKVVKWMVKSVTQFPSDQEVARYIATITDKDLQKKCVQCSEIIRAAKLRQEAEANKMASILLEQLDLEKTREESKKAAAARKREKKKKKKAERKEEEKEEIVHESSPPPDRIPTKPEAPSPVPDKTPSTPPVTVEPPAKEPARTEKKRNIDKAENRREEKKGKENKNSKRNKESEEIKQVNGVMESATTEQRIRFHEGQTRINALDTFNEYDMTRFKPNTVVTPRKGQGKQREEGWKEVTRSSVARSKKVVVPSTAISRVIGRGGCNINAIRESSGAHIEIEKLGKGQVDRTVVIKGTMESMKLASEWIAALIQYSDKEITDIIPVTKPSAVSSAVVTTPVVKPVTTVAQSKSRATTTTVSTSAPSPTATGWVGTNSPKRPKPTVAAVSKSQPVTSIYNNDKKPSNYTTPKHSASYSNNTNNNILPITTSIRNCPPPRMQAYAQSMANRHSVPTTHPSRPSPTPAVVSTVTQQKPLEASVLAPISSHSTVNSTTTRQPEYSPFNLSIFGKGPSMWSNDSVGMNFASVAATGVSLPSATSSGISNFSDAPAVDAAKAPGYRRDDRTMVTQGINTPLSSTQNSRSAPGTPGPIAPPQRKLNTTPPPFFNQEQHHPQQQHHSYNISPPVQPPVSLQNISPPLQQQQHSGFNMPYPPQHSPPSHHPPRNINYQQFHQPPPPTFSQNLLQPVPGSGPVQSKLNPDAPDFNGQQDSFNKQFLMQQQSHPPIGQQYGAPIDMERRIPLPIGGERRQRFYEGGDWANDDCKNLILGQSNPEQTMANLQHLMNGMSSMAAGDNMWPFKLPIDENTDKHVQTWNSNNWN